jgi:uncharacterized membrane protein YfcA
MHLTIYQWIFAASAALLTGFSKTGMPGAGILVVPLLAILFQGRLSAGAMLPMLLLGDVFAVAWYRRHAQWDKLWGLIPWVLGGFAVGTVLFLTVPPKAAHQKDWMNVIIGAIVLFMLAVHVLRQYFGDRLTPHSTATIAATGGAAGFTTMVSNAAGPVMTIYLQAMGMTKEEFMGTSAWFFFIVNLAKLPVYIGLTFALPREPMFTRQSLVFDIRMIPLILLGLVFGKLALSYIPQKTFNALVLILAAVAAIHLVM